MSDKWMNLGYDNQDLKPYSEPTPDFKDERRIGEDFVISYNLSIIIMHCCMSVSRTSSCSKCDSNFFIFRNYASNGIFKR